MRRYYEDLSSCRQWFLSKVNGVGRAVFPPDFEAELLNTTAYLENALVLEYLFILVLLISEEKRSVRRLACATEDDLIFTLSSYILSLQRIYDCINLIASRLRF